MGGESLVMTDCGYGYVKGFKHPGNDKQREWWGSRGNMDVQLLSQSGPISFHVKDST